MVAPIGHCCNCRHKFVDDAYKFCPMYATYRLLFSMDASTTEELDVGEQQHRGHPIPSYEQIFVHTPLKKGKLYKRKFLSTYYPDEYHKCLNNQEKAKGWLTKEGFLNPDDKKSHEKYLADLKQMCLEKYRTLELLDFNLVQIPWHSKEIYKYLLEHTTYLSKRHSKTVRFHT